MYFHIHRHKKKCALHNIEEGLNLKLAKRSIERHQYPVSAAIRNGFLRKSMTTVF